MTPLMLVLMIILESLKLAIEVQKDMTPERAEKVWQDWDKFAAVAFGWVEKLIEAEQPNARS